MMGRWLVARTIDLLFAFVDGRGEGDVSEAEFAYQDVKQVPLMKPVGMSFQELARFGLKWAKS